MSNNGVESISNTRKKITQTHKFISAIYHEAGHAIYGLLHNIKIHSLYVYLKKKNSEVGGCYYEIPKDLYNVQDPTLLFNIAQSEIGLLYSGLVAEKLFFKNISGSDKFPMFLKNGSSDDTLAAATIIKQYNLVTAGKKRYLYKRSLEKDSLNNLQKYWDDVIMISHNLFEKNNLNYFDLKEILTKKSKNKEFWKQKFKNIDIMFANEGGLDENKIKIILEE